MFAGDVDAYRSFDFATSVAPLRMTRKIKFPRNFASLLFEFTEILRLEIGDVHQDAVDDAGVCNGFPRFGNFGGKFDFPIGTHRNFINGFDADRL